MVHPTTITIALYDPLEYNEYLLSKGVDIAALKAIHGEPEKPEIEAA